MEKQKSIIDEQIVSIIQDPQISQAIGKNKALQINIQIVGDSAITKATAHNAQLKELMRNILECLPHPKMMWLKALAMAVALEDGRQSTSAMARYLDIAPRLNWRKEGSSWRDKIAAINGGEIEFTGGEKTTPTTLSG